MQIPKSLLIICMAALGVSSLHAQRADSDVQAKAREQLRQKISELKSQPQGNPVPAAKPIEKPVVVAPVQPVSQQTVIEVAPVTPPAAAIIVAEPAPIDAKNEAEKAEQAREVMRKKLEDLNAQDKTVSPAVVKVAPQAAQPKVKVVKPVVVAEPKKAKVTKVAVTEPKKTKAAKKADFDPAFATPAVAAAPVANSKDAKLADLLQQYKADKITPTEYHLQRAKIISEP